MTEPPSFPAPAREGWGFFRMSGVGRIMDPMSDWHPIFLTTEVTPGTWEMTDPLAYAPFGRIELRRVDENRLRYKVWIGAKHIGWATTLQAACEGLYLERQKTRDAVYAGPPNGIVVTPQGTTAR